MEKITKPLIINIGDIRCLGIPVKSGTKISKITNVTEIDDDDNVKASLPYYIQRANLKTLQDYEVGANLDYISRTMDEEESLHWDMLLRKYEIIEKTAMTKWTNQLFRESL